MQYLAWRVLVGLNKTITLSFLIPGHTKFAPDWCFGLLKWEFRRTKVGCLDDIVRVEKSATVNHAQLVGTQDGRVLVPMYDWANFFSTPFRQAALKGIKSMHHLTFSIEKPGTAMVKDTVSAPVREFNRCRISAGGPIYTIYPRLFHHLGYLQNGGSTSSKKFGSIAQSTARTLYVRIQLGTI